MTRMECRRFGVVIGWLISIQTICLVSLVGAAPANDNFANATPIYGATNFSASNVDATAETGEPAHAGTAARASLWWKWTAPFTASFSVVTSNSFVTNRIGLDTTIAVYSGTNLTNLSLVVANDDTDLGEFGATWSRAVFRAALGETLMIAADTIGTNGTIQMRIGLAGPVAAPWQATNLQGEPVYSTNFSGKVVMVDFWETTCGACVEELPDVINVQYYLNASGFTFFGLSGDPDVPTVTNYLASHKGINYPMGMSNPSVQDILAGGPVGFPTKLLLDREGRIVGKYLGGHTADFYRSLVEPLLRANPPPTIILTRTNTVVKLSWPASATGYSVERAAGPVSGWSPLGFTPSLSGGQYVVSVPGTAAAQFFRLVKP